MLLATVALAAPPKLTSLFPAGAQRGQSITVTASGEFSTWPVQAAADQPGVTAVADPEKGKLKVTIAPDAAAGIVWLRAYNDEGASSQRPFIVGTLPEIEEVEPNDTPAKPQVVNEKGVINGKLAKFGDLDAFQVTLKQGQTLVASLQAHQVLGSPMDAVLQVCEVLQRRGKPEAFVLEQNHDAQGLDPQIAFAAPHDGEYLVRVFAYPSEPGASITYFGGENYIYRLTLTSGGFADYALPLAIERSKPSEVKLLGWNLPPTGLPATISSPDNRSSATAFHADVAGSIPLAVVDCLSIVATGAGRESPQPLSTPVVVSGQLMPDHAAHHFRFEAKKGARLKIACPSRSLGYPLMARLRVRTETGQQLSAADASHQQSEPEFVFTAPADGKFDLAISDLFGRSGDRFVYRLSVEEPRPEFGLQLAADSFILTAGQPLTIPVTVAAPRSEITLPIELTATELPAGLSCEPVKSSAEAKLGEVINLVLKPAPDAQLPAGFPIRVQGKSGPTQRVARVQGGPAESTIWITVKK